MVKWAQMSSTSPCPCEESQWQISPSHKDSTPMKALKTTTSHLPLEHLTSWQKAMECQGTVLSLWVGRKTKRRMGETTRHTRTLLVWACPTTHPQLSMRTVLRIWGDKTNRSSTIRMATWRSMTFTTTLAANQRPLMTKGTPMITTRTQTTTSYSIVKLMCSPLIAPASCK